MISYSTDFQWSVYARLGGLEFGEAFFARHPRMIESMRRYALLHAVKCSDVEAGVDHFYTTVLGPILQCDRKQVNVADIMDPRD